MTARPWCRRFLPVDPHLLRVDLPEGSTSPKGYSDRELEDIAAQIPRVYDALLSGATPDQLLACRQSPDPRQRAMGETYAQLFGRVPGAQGLTADWDGGALVVASGNHRARAAARIGI